MEILSGLVSVSFLILNAVIGVRLLQLAGRLEAESGGKVPERWLGLFFLLYSFLAAAMNMALYAGWSDPELKLPETLERILHAGFYWIGSAGIVSLTVFTRRTFRPDSRAAAAAVVLVALTLAATSLWAGVSEGYELRVLNGAAYWVAFAARDLCFVWIAFESFRYGAMLRRRLALGLADPLIANRFLLMGIWGATLAVLTHSDPIARLCYWWITGTTVEWIPEQGRPILLAGMTVATGGLSLAGGALLLTFFPIPAYRRWLEGRSAGACS